MTGFAALVALSIVLGSTPVALQSSTDANNDRATRLQQEINLAIAAGKADTIFLFGTYNFSRKGLHIAGATGLTLKPAANCSSTPLLLFSLWPCGEELGSAARICRPVNFSNPTSPSTCFNKQGKQCTCPDVVWSSGVNITDSERVIVQGLAIDYYPRSLPNHPCKGGDVGEIDADAYATAGSTAGSTAANIAGAGATAAAAPVQFNSGRQYTYHIFNSSKVVTEDLSIRSAPFMAITSFLGEGGHIFKRVSFTPHPKNFSAMVAGKDGLHESDVRNGLQYIDSKIHGTADDFFNFHNTLQIVYSCDAATSSCLVVNPHIDGVPDNTVYGSQRVLATVRAGDRFSFYPLSHFPHPENNTPPILATATVATKNQVTDKKLLKQIAAWALKTASNYTNRLMHFGDGSDCWNVSFGDVSAGSSGSNGDRGLADLSKVSTNSLVNIDSISGAGAVIRDCHFSVTACNLGRTKSSNSLITNTTFSFAASKNLEVTGLQIWFEGPMHINNVSITNNTFVGEGPKGTVIHVSKIATNVKIEGNRYL